MRKMIALILVILFIGVAMAGCTSTTTTKKNKPPVATFTVSPGTEVTHKQVVTFDASASTDPDKNDVKILTYEWDFKDGTKIPKGTMKVVTHAFETDGKYQVWLYVYDAKVMSAFSKNISVTNQPPKIVSFYPADNVSVIETNSQDFVVNVTDTPNDDTPIYQWSVDNQEIQGENSKTFSYLPTYEDAGAHNVTIRVNDGKGGIIYKTWSVTVINKNQPPVINTYSPIADEVTLAELSAQTFSVTASDPDSDPLTYGWYMDNKVITGQTVTSFNYQPDYNAAGFHVLMALVSDGQGGTVNRSWNVTITNTNRAPIITATNPVAIHQNMNETDSKKFQITAMDPDSDPMTYSWTLDTIDISGTSGNNYTYVPTLQDAGDHVLSVTVSDGKGGTNSTEWHITVGNLNQPPQITGFTPATNPTVAENAYLNFTVTASDPDGDAMTYQWSLNGTNLTGKTAATFEFHPDYSMGDPSQKTHTVKVYVKDTTNGIVEHAWTATVTNVDRAPVAHASVNMSKPGIGLDIKLDASASTDPDGDTLSFTWNFGDGTPNQGGKIVTHTYVKVGLFNATVTVSDGTLSSQSQVQVDVNITQSWISGPLGWVGPIVVDDVDGDGTNEIVVGGVESFISNVYTGYLYIYDASTHSQEFKSADIGRVNDIKVADVDGDAAKEIIVGTLKSTTPVGSGGTYNGHVYVFGSSGSHTQEFMSAESGNYNCIGIGNLDSSGNPEIVAPRADNFFPSAGGIYQYGNISIYGYSGSYSKVWQSTNFDGFGRALDIGDIDGDGAVEAVIGTLDSFDIAAQALKGRVVTVAYNTPNYVIQNTYSGVGQVNDVVIADVDKDNNMDAVVGMINKTTNTHNMGYIEVLTKTLAYKWISKDYGSVTCIAVADLDHDTLNEVAFGVDYNHTEDKVNPAILYPEGYFYVLNGQSLTQEKFKSAQIGAVMSLAVGNLDKDVNTLEVAVGTWNKQDASMNYEGYLYVFSYSTTDTKFVQLWRSNKIGQVGTNSIVMADLDKDGFMDIALGTSDSAGALISGKIYVFSNKSVA